VSEPSDLQSELRSLRRGVGLTLAKLGGSPAILAALGTNDPREAHRRLVAAVDQLGGRIQVQALRNAYAIGMRDPRNLTVRRGDFSQFNNRHADTIEAYENEAIDELAAALQYAQPVEEPDVLAFWVRYNGHFPMPLYMVQLPGTRRPDKLQVYLYVSPKPLRCWAIEAADLNDFVAMHKSYLVPVEEIGDDEATIKHAFTNPKRNYFYGLYWEYEERAVPLTPSR
jgi:hypothetical protein